MPGMGGLELTGRLRKYWPDLEVLYMSGYAEGDKLEPGLHDSTHEFLQKPFSADRLVHKVREVLDAKQRRGL
jgi:CheY-like chemotaxis protein